MSARPADPRIWDAQLTSLYEHLPVGIAIFDPAMHLLHANPSWAAFVQRATGVEVRTVKPRTPLNELLSTIEDELSEVLQIVLGGQAVQKNGISYSGPAGETFWDLSIAPILDNGVVTGVISIVADATPRIMAERAATAKARLTAFRADVSNALASSDNVDAVLHACAEAMVRHAPATFARIWVFDEAEDIFRLRASAGLYTRLNGQYSRIPATMFATHQPGFASDLLRTHEVRDLTWAREQGLTAWASQPLQVRGQVIGLMIMFGQQDYDSDTLNELAAVADAIAQFLERTHAENALREREELFRRVFEAAADGLIITDLETGRILEVNPAICALHGYTREEFMQLSRGAVVDPGSVDTWSEYVQTIREGRVARAHARALRKDGTAFHAEAQGSPILYQGKPAALGIIRDVTDEQEQHQLLERSVEERTRELQTLLDISRAISLTPELDPLIELILDQMRRLVEYESVAISLNEGGVLTNVATRRGETGSRYPISPNRTFSVNLPTPAWQELIRGTTMYTPNVHADDPVAETFRLVVGDQLQTSYGHIVSFVATPLMVKNELVGLIFISSTKEDRYTQHDIDLITATANQVAIAIQNARLHGQTRAMAALEERQRLARELHDSVSQALYGIGLGARTARTQLDRDPAQVAAPLDYVLQLAEAGMAEMRALIFELRPESLEQEGLVAALEKQAAATRVRHMIEVNLSLSNEPECSLETKEVLYRIAQEAMHNTVKHARATTIEVSLAICDGRLLLDIADNGQGFDTSDSFPGHLGLVSMRERATRVGGAVTVISPPSEGTRVHVEVPV